MSKLLVLDGGHGGSDPGAIGPNGTKEKNVVMKIIDKVVNALKTYDITIAFTRDTDKFIELSERANIANKMNADYFISIHCNSYSDKNSNGTETFTYTSVDQNTMDFANAVHNNLVNVIQLRDRGVKKANFAVLRETSMPAILVEVGFISNPKEEKLLADDKFLDKVAAGIVRGIVSQLKLEKIGTPIIGAATATVEQCKEWAKSKQAKQIFIDNADIYFEICKEVGINPVMAYVQYALESGYGHHKGTVPEAYHNPCGLKVSEGGSDADKDAHKKFDNWKDGISAHVDHIALYAGVKGYPKANSLDPRHFSYLYNKYKTVEDIGKGWCPSNPEYGNTLIKFMKEVKNIKVTGDEEYKRAVTKLAQELDINMAAWYPEPNLKNLKALVEKIGSKLYGITDYKFIINRLKQDGVVCNELLWLEYEYSVGNIKSLIKKVAAHLG